MGAFVAYVKPLKADLLDSDLVQGKNDYWRFTFEETDLDNDLKFNDFVVKGWHKGMPGDPFDVAQPGPMLSVTFKDVDVGDTPKAKTDEKAHGAFVDILYVSWLKMPNVQYAEAMINLTHSKPVPEPSAVAMTMVGGLLVAMRFRKRAGSSTR